MKELIQNCQNKQEVNQVFRLTAPLSLIWLTEADCDNALADFSKSRKTEKL